MPVEHCLKLALGHCTHDRIDYLAILEYGNERDALHIVAHRQILIGIDVDFANFQVAVFAGQLINHRANSLAGTTPRSPEIDQHWPIGLLFSLFACFPSAGSDLFG
jgi:hypothetical protein